MLGLLCILSYKLTGKWNGEFATSTGEKGPFKVKVKSNQNNYTAFIRSKVNHKLLPKKVIFEEEVENMTYSIYLPEKTQKMKFATFVLNSTAPLNGRSGKTTSLNDKYDISVTFSGDHQIEFSLFRKGKGEWIKYIVCSHGYEFVHMPLTVSLYVAMCVAILIFSIWVIKKLFRLQSKQNNSKDKEE